MGVRYFAASDYLSDYFLEGRVAFSTCAFDFCWQDEQSEQDNFYCSLYVLLCIYSNHPVDDGFADLLLFVQQHSGDFSQ